MEFPQFESIIKRIFYLFILLIVFAVAAVFWFMFDVFLFWKYTPLGEWSPLGRVLWMTFSVLTTFGVNLLIQKNMWTFQSPESGKKKRTCVVTGGTDGRPPACRRGSLYRYSLGAARPYLHTPLPERTESLLKARLVEAAAIPTFPRRSHCMEFALRPRPHNNAAPLYSTTPSGVSTIRRC